MKPLGNKPAKAGGAPGAARPVPVSPDNSDTELGPAAPARSPEPPALPLRAGSRPGPRRGGLSAAPAGRARAALYPPPGRLTAPERAAIPQHAAIPGGRCGGAALSPGLAAHGGGAPATRRRPFRARTARARPERRPFRPAGPAGAPRRAEGAAPPGHAHRTQQRQRKRVTNRLLIENNPSGNKH